MRTLKEGVAYTSDVVHKCPGQLLTQANGDIDTSGNYAQYDYLHSGLIVFPDVFLDEMDSETQLLYVGGYEKDSTLFKPDFTLYLFNTCDIVPVKNNAFTFSANTGIEKVESVQDIISANWKSVYSAGSAVRAYLKQAITVPDILTQAPGNRDLYGIAVFNNAVGGKFQTSSELRLWLGVKYS